VFKKTFVVLAITFSSVCTYAQGSGDVAESSIPKISPSEQTAGSATDLIATIDELKSLEFIKSDFETETEYFDRVSQLYSEYDARRYEFELECSHKEENFSSGPQAALTSYEADSTLKF